MRRSRWFLLLLCCSLLTTGCAHQNILENLGLALASGYDRSEDGKIIVTISMPEVSEEAKEKVQTISAKGDLLHEAVGNLSQATDRQVVNGQLRTIVISKDLAKNGVWRALDTVQRDPSVTSTLVVCISDGSAGELLKKRFPTKPSTGRYLFELLRKESKNYSVPHTTLHDFMREHFDDGSDAFAPYIRLHEDNIIAAGTALFHDDRYVGHLSAEETKLLLLLRGRGEGGDIKQTLHTHTGGVKSDQIILTFVRTKHTYKVSMKNNKPLIQFNVKVQGQVIEYSGTQPLTDDKVVEDIERRIEEGLRERMKNLVNRLQHQYHSDPLGIGDHIRTKGFYHPWNRNVWRKAYEEAEIQVNFKLNIIRTGITK